jgi:hypothetical protein
VTQLVVWLSSNTAALSIFGAAVAFIWSTTQQISQRRAEAREREFQAFHKLVKDLVEPEPEIKILYVDRQAAVIFELRHFPRYYEFTQRMLQALRREWKDETWLRVAQEIDLTLDYIRRKK